MATFKKAVLKVGETMQSPDGPVPITAERLAHFADQHKKLKAAGYSVPSRWEHADAPEGMLPLAAEEMKKKLDGRHAVGEMVEFDYTPGADQATLTLEITDPRAVQQCDANRVKLSPIIAAGWKDGRGNPYTDFLSHADLVERPVDYSQGPFARVPEVIACSLEKYLSADTIRLAFPPDDDDDDEDEGDDKGGKTPESEAEAAAAPETPAGPAKNPDAPPKATDKTKTAAVIDGLKQKNIVLPSDFDFAGDSAIDVLIAAINSSIAAELKSEAEKPEKEESPPTVASPGYSAMSTETKAAVEYANTMKREKVDADLQALLASGRCTPTEVTERKDAVAAVRLSLDAENKPIDSDLEKWIASRKPLPKGTFWSDEQKTRLSTEVAVAELPEDMGGVPSDEEVEKRIEAQLKRTGFAR